MNYEQLIIIAQIRLELLKIAIKSNQADPIGEFNRLQKLIIPNQITNS